MLIGAPEIAAYAKAVIEDRENFFFLKECCFACMWTDEEIIQKGAVAAGVVFEPQAQGTPSRHLLNTLLANEFPEDPQFFLVVDQPIWNKLKDLERIHLIHHELKHPRHRTTSEGEPTYNEETGRPNLKFVGHDAEIFLETLRLYGDFQGQAMRVQAAAEVGIDVDSVKRIQKKLKKQGILFGIRMSLKDEEDAAKAAAKSHDALITPAQRKEGWSN